MQPGDLVHVTADNFYFGLGIILECDVEDAISTLSFYVMTSDGKCMFYFADELEPVQPDSA
jgi:hypothetical protein